MSNEKREILKLTKTALDEAAEIFRKSLKDQGHVLTGTLLRSIKALSVEANGIIAAYIEMEDYFEVVDKGVSSNNIPFNPGSGNKTSKYINALIRFFKLRGLSNKRAKSAAFATAYVHKREGMPTKRSSVFSVNGRRTGFVSKNINAVNKKFIELIDNKVNDLLFGKFILELDKIYKK